MKFELEYESLKGLRHAVCCRQSTLPKTDTFGTGTKCPSYRESNTGSKERQRPTLGVHFTEVSVKRESTIN